MVIQTTNEAEIRKIQNELERSKQTVLHEKTMCAQV